MKTTRPVFCWLQALDFEKAAAWAIAAAVTLFFWGGLILVAGATL